MPDARLLFIHALTGLHPGAGTAPGVVDLPVQRERHTRWPLIPGSSLKGVLRSACRTQLEREDLRAAFGPETANAGDFGGALSITDARLLAFPVRSLRGVFAWVTCRPALDRFARDAQLLVGIDCVPAAPEVERGKAACSGEGLLIADRLVLEEFEYEPLPESDAASAVACWLSDHVLCDEATRRRLQRNLVVLHEDDFTWFVRHATEIVARVGLDYKTKTVKDGALFYEEFLPAETIFHATVIAVASRSNRVKASASEMLERLQGALPKVLQIGADETIGKGLCAVRLTGADETARMEASE